jgi:hypothetical protein
VVMNVARKRGRPQQSPLGGYSHGGVRVSREHFQIIQRGQEFEEGRLLYHRAGETTVARLGVINGKPI